MLYYIRHDGRMRHLELQFRLSEIFLWFLVSRIIITSSIARPKDILCVQNDFLQPKNNHYRFTGSTEVNWTQKKIRLPVNYRRHFCISKMDIPILVIFLIPRFPRSPLVKSMVLLCTYCKGKGFVIALCKDPKSHLKSPRTLASGRQIRIKS